MMEARPHFVSILTAISLSLLLNRWINEHLLKEQFGSSKGISRRTAHNWMQQLGFKWSRHQKCVYVDGHNRPDVLEARAEFVAKMLVLRKRMSM